MNNFAVPVLSLVVLAISVSTGSAFDDDGSKVIFKNPNTGEVSTGKPVAPGGPQGRTNRAAAPKAPKPSILTTSVSLPAPRERDAKPELPMAARRSDGLVYRFEFERPNGDRGPVTADSTFATKDMLWIRVRAPLSGRVQVLERTAGYSPRLIFPDPEVLSSTDHVNADEDTFLLSDGRPFEFDNRVGEVCLMLVFTADHEQRLQISGLTKPTADDYSKGLSAQKKDPVKSAASNADFGNAVGRVGCDAILRQVN